jgi:hypothetical protein
VTDDLETRMEPRDRLRTMGNVFRVAMLLMILAGLVFVFVIVPLW